jgi:diaminopimelate epimerase
LKTWGGDELIVDFQRVGNRYDKVSLTGPAKTVFTGEFELKDFNYLTDMEIKWQK